MARQPTRMRMGYSEYNIEEYSGKDGVNKIILWDKRNGSKLRTVTGKLKIRRILSGK